MEPTKNTYLGRKMCDAQTVKISVCVCVRACVCALRACKVMRKKATSSCPFPWGIWTSTWFLEPNKSAQYWRNQAATSWTLANHQYSIWQGATFAFPGFPQHTHTHTFNGPLSGTTRVSRYQKGKNQSGFYWSKRQWVAVASAGLCASLHLAPDR